MRFISFMGSRAMVAWFAWNSPGSAHANENDGTYRNAESPTMVVPRSNSTHIIWKVSDTTTEMDGIIVSKGSPRASSRHLKSVLGPGKESSRSKEVSRAFEIQSYEDAYQESLILLRNNLMEFDHPFLETLGFPLGSETPTADGLGNGLIGPTIELALKAKMDYPWTDDLPKDIFQEYVLNYANLNEARTNWRPLLVDALKFNESALWQHGEANLTSVVTWVNQNLWNRLGRPGKPIYFHSGQTPLIFDPMSIIAFGYASCTGTSILFTNALRSVGVPARVVGTPAWYGNRTMGNHNWVEVYTGADTSNDSLVGGDPWKFLEPSPANAGLDTLDTDPCSRWFCQSSRYPSSKVYAAKLVGPIDDAAATYFPLAWEWHNQDVPGVDRTDYYTEICKSCKG